MTVSLADVAEQLDGELVGWLTTVTPDGQPQSTVVWFLRDGDELLIYSQPDRPKLRNIEVNPLVAFNLRSDEAGDEFLTMEGSAHIEGSEVRADQIPAYLAKYTEQIHRLGWTTDSFAADYSVPIRVAFDKIRR